MEQAKAEARCEAIRARTEEKLARNAEEAAAYLAGEAVFFLRTSRLPQCLAVWEDLVRKLLEAARHLENGHIMMYSFYFRVHGLGDRVWDVWPALNKEVFDFVRNEEET